MWLPCAQASLALSVAITLARTVGRITESACGFTWHQSSTIAVRAERGDEEPEARKEGQRAPNIPGAVSQVSEMTSG